MTGRHGNRTRNMQIAGRETGSPDHSAIRPPQFSVRKHANSVAARLVSYGVWLSHLARDFRLLYFAAEQLLNGVFPAHLGGKDTVRLGQTAAWFRA